ncbi:MAG: bifunctional folylpolyglutamate synthase/dihydrofolate synthase [Eggerthellaceae bacterium]|jgi:dihydrofolate synthase/folylpolyglutamate synthase
MFDPIAYINEPRWHHSVLGLTRISALLEKLGRPQDDLRFVHVAGTNGKGSTCAFIASILQEAGYTTGLFTSPFIMQFEERIRVNKDMISYEDLYALTLEIKDAADKVEEEEGTHPTEFELMTALAFLYFNRKGCDIAVVEVGLGGRLDSTNVIENPLVSVITRIGLDHTAVLGKTLGAIAKEKAGIIKSSCPVVSYPQDSEAATSIADIARAKNASLTVPDFEDLVVGSVTWQTEASLEGGAVIEHPERSFSYHGNQFRTRLLGSYQPYNAGLALETVEVLKDQGLEISDEDCRRGIAKTIWPGRFELVQRGSDKGILIIDGGHNVQGAEALTSSLANVFPNKKVVFVVGMLADKDYTNSLSVLIPYAAAFVTITPPNERALSGHRLAEEIKKRLHDEKTEPVPIYETSSIAEAMELADRLAGADGIVTTFGSLYSIAAIKEAVH